MRIAVGDTTLFFDVDGAQLVPDGAALRERPTLLLLHGGPGADHSLYKPWLSGLAADMQVIYLDHRGQGRSDPAPEGRRTLRTWAADVHAFCGALGIVRPFVMGCSFGSFVALQHAADFPDEPAGLILGAAAARIDVAAVAADFGRRGGPVAAAAARTMFGGDATLASRTAFRATCARHYAARGTPAPERDARIVARDDVSLGWLRGEGASFDLRGRAGDVRCPVLVVNGAEDPVTRPDAARELVAALPPGLAELRLLDGVAHDLDADAGDEVRELVRSWVLRRAKQA